jgi:TonB family protein
MIQRFANKFRTASGALLLIASAGAASAQIDANRPNGADEPPPLALDTKQDGSPASPPARTPGSTRWVAYANETQARVDAYLTNRRETFGEKLNFSAELWVDAQGHITRTQLVSASGNAAFDAAARKNFAPGLVLPPPEKDMPLPIRVRATSK